MGSTNISQIGYGFTAKSVYDNLCEEAESYYGHQEGYSVAINSTRGFREVKINGINTGELVPLKTGGKGIDSTFLNKVLVHHDSLLNKFDKFSGVACVNLGIMQYVKLAIKCKTMSKRVFERYTLYSSSGRPIEFSANLNYLERKAEATIYATGSKVSIGGTLKNGNTVIVKQYEVTQTASRRKPKDMKGCKPMYAYWFVGWASC